MNFSQALESCKSGQRIARSGWNGKGMYLLFVPEGWSLPSGMVSNFERHLPWIGMRTAQGDFVPWLASQTDILADDWEVAK